MLDISHLVVQAPRDEAWPEGCLSTPTLAIVLDPDNAPSLEVNLWRLAQRWMDPDQERTWARTEAALSGLGVAQCNFAWTPLGVRSARVWAEARQHLVPLEAAAAGYASATAQAGEWVHRQPDGSWLVVHTLADIVRHVRGGMVVAVRVP